LVAYVWSFGPYVPPGPGDIRGPCPMLQALANHGEINHDGTFNRDQLVNAINKNTGMCKNLANVQLEALFIRDPRQLGKPGPPADWVLDQSHLTTFEGGERDGGIAHTDRIFGDVTLFNASKWAISTGFSSDGTTMGFWDLWKAHTYWLNQSNFDNGRTNQTIIDYHGNVGASNMGTLWLAFGQKNISIADLNIFMSGRFPPSYTPPTTEWCVRDWLNQAFIGKTGGQLPSDDEYLFIACKKAVAGIDVPYGYICEYEFQYTVTALNQRSQVLSTFPNPTPEVDFKARGKAFDMQLAFLKIPLTTTAPRTLKP